VAETNLTRNLNNHFFLNDSANIKTNQNENLKKIRLPLKEHFANKTTVTPEFDSFFSPYLMPCYTSGLNALIKRFLEPRG